MKNVFVWLAGQLGASLQEYVTRDLRDAVFRHMQRLPLGYFQRTKAGQIISTILSDTDQTKALITELVTRTRAERRADHHDDRRRCSRCRCKLTCCRSSSRRCSRSRCSRCCARCARAIAVSAATTARATSVLQEVVSGMRLVKSFGGEPYEDRRFGEASHRYSDGHGADQSRRRRSRSR